MGAALSTGGLVLLASALLAGSTGCAATSCPAVYLSSIVHVDAAAWLASGQSTHPVLTATVCLAANCVKATPVLPTTPDDLLAGFSLPTGKATVRVKLDSSDGRSLDQTTTADVTLTKPFGGGCAGREEIDLTVTKAGSLVLGRPAKVS